MKITEHKITVRELCENYKDDGDGGVFAYNNRLTVRPAYQREFVYKDKQRDAVIESIRNNYPLNVMYWSKTGDDKYEVLDGQQRTISICQYINKDYSINHRFFHNLTKGEQDQLLNYELTIYVCEGTDTEKLAWFKVINIAGEVLTPQELLNATYTGPWLSDAKKHFSQRNCAASQMADGYMKGNPIRQDYLEKVLKWVANRDGLANGQEYMAQHQLDTNANDIWLYFCNVINWVKATFRTKRKGMDSVEWGLLYNKYGTATPANTSQRVDMLFEMSDEISSPNGIYEAVLSGELKHLQAREFDKRDKLWAFNKQNGICPYCRKQFDISQMHGDHIKPWSKGGITERSNLQMLCAECNGKKSNYDIGFEPWDTQTYESFDVQKWDNGDYDKNTMCIVDD